MKTGYKNNRRVKNDNKLYNRVIESGKRSKYLDLECRPQRHTTAANSKAHAQRRLDWR